MDVIKRLAPFLRKYRKWIYLSIASNILLSIFTVVSIPLIIPFFRLLFQQDAIPKSVSLSGFEMKISDLFSRLIESLGKEQALIVVCLALAGVFLLKNIFRYLALVTMAPVRNGIVYELRQKIHTQLLYMPIAYFAEQQKGDLIARATADVAEVEWSVLNVIEAIFKAPIIMLGSLCFMFFINFKLSLIVLVLLLFVALVIGGISRSLRKGSSELQTSIGKISSTIEETINGTRVIKAFNSEPFRAERFEQVNGRLRFMMNKFMKRRELAVPMSEFLGVTIVVFLLWLGARMVFRQEMLAETFFAYIFAFYQVIEPSKLFTNAYSNIQKGSAALDRIYEIIQHKTEEKRENETHEKLEFKEGIEFEKVSFSYDKAHDSTLSDISFKVNKGQTCALVGASGSGKSTVIDLLLGHYKNYSGKIKIDGRDISSLDNYSLRSLFGVVTQEAILFNDTIAENIKLGRFFSDEEVDKALELANASSFVRDVGGLKYNVGDKGMKLSGGQKQRITIARAVLSNPPILLLDEATSALDNESETIVQNSVDNAMKGRTAIIVAHRLTTIQNADFIIVMDKGRVVEVGNHHELLAFKGLYYNMVYQ